MLHLRNRVVELVVADRKVIVADSVHDAHNGFTASQTADGIALGKVAAADQSDVGRLLTFEVTLTGKFGIALNGAVDVVLVEDNDRLGALAGSQQQGYKKREEIFFHICDL